MGLFTVANPLAFTFGVLGNIISFMVYLAPIPTFRGIVKKGSTEGFHATPYLVGHFSAVLWIYYALVKGDATLLLTINSFGCLIETVYLAIFITYAPKVSRITTLKFLVLFNIGLFSSIVLFSHFAFKGEERLSVLGWICMACSAAVFVAPMSIVAQVIRTKRVDFMPFSLSFFLAISAVMWFFYGLLMKDLFITVPNILGFILGVIQMGLYAMYKNHKGAAREQELPTAVKPTNSTPEIHPDPLPSASDGTPENVQSHTVDQMETGTDGPDRV